MESGDHPGPHHQAEPAAPQDSGGSWAKIIGLAALFFLIALVALIIVGFAAGSNREDNTVPEVEQQDRVIAAVHSTNDPSKLRVAWFPAPCETFDEVEVQVDDTYANLRVRVSVDVAGGVEACSKAPTTEAIVDLGEPLGNRKIWDRAFNDTVALDAD